MFIWIEKETVLGIHEEQITEHGGISGLRDLHLLETALSRPLHASYYSSNPDIATVAAAYAFGISSNHPFLDGNKRVAAVLLELSLDLNGFELTATNEQCFSVMIALAKGGVREEDLEAWIRNNMRPVKVST